MGQFIGGHQISIGQVRQSLLEAAESVFDDPAEADSVLRIVGGALEKGAESPLLESQSEWADSSTSIVAKDTSYWIERWRAVDWHELWMRETVNQWLVPGMVAKYRAHVLYSDAGVGKSLLALDISAALASGKSCLGHSPIEPIKVVYLDHENDDELDVKPRLMSMGYAPEDLSNLTLFVFFILLFISNPNFK
jgi:RecA-family ATPase